MYQRIRYEHYWDEAESGSKKKSKGTRRDTSRQNLQCKQIRGRRQCEESLKCIWDTDRSSCGRKY